MLATIERSCISVFLAIAIFLGGCSPAAQANLEEYPVTCEIPTNFPQLQGMATVEMTIDGAAIVMEIDGNAAPVTAGNFIDLASKNVYDGLMFHRVIREPEPFVVQGGDPLSANPDTPSSRLGTGNYIDPDTHRTRYIPLEIQPESEECPVYGRPLEGVEPELKHREGAIAMARSPNPNTASAQFYIALADLPFLDGSYAVFGYVISGMEAVKGIEFGDRIESMRVVRGGENLQQPTPLN